MSSSVAPLALSHALRRWIHNAPQDQQTLASAIETLRADETDEAVDLLTSTLLHAPTLRWLSGVDTATPAVQNGGGMLAQLWAHDRIVRWTCRFLVRVAHQVLVCHNASTGRLESVACVLQPSGGAGRSIEAVQSELEASVGPLMGGDEVWQRAEWLWQKTASLRAAALPLKEEIGLRASSSSANALTAAPRAPAWHVLAIATQPDMQGRGIGSLLLAEIAALGAVSNRAVVAQCSAGAHGVYTSRGYTVRSRLRVAGAEDRAALSLSSAEVCESYPSSGADALRVLLRPAMDRAGRDARNTWRWQRPDNKSAALYR